MTETLPWPTDEQMEDIFEVERWCRRTNKTELEAALIHIEQAKYLNYQADPKDLQTAKESK